MTPPGAARRASAWPRRPAATPAACSSGSRRCWPGSRRATAGTPPNARWAWWAWGTWARSWRTTPRRGGFRVVCCDPPREARERLGFRTLEETAAEADILTFHTPLDDTTRHMASAAALFRPHETRRHDPQQLARRGGGRRGAAPQRTALCPRRLGSTNPGPTRRCWPAHCSRHAPRGRLLAPGQGQRHGSDRARPGPRTSGGLWPTGTPRIRPVRAHAPSRGRKCATMPRYFDIAAQSDRLKGAARGFRGAPRQLPLP